MVARSGGYAGQNFVLTVLHRPARQDSDAAIDVAPCRHAGRPVAALDDAWIEIDRVAHSLEMAVAFRALVPGGLELLQCMDQVIGGGDRIRSGAGLEHVHGMAAHLEAKPDHADLRTHHTPRSR